jgi:hypothetical protein
MADVKKISPNLRDLIDWADAGAEAGAVIDAVISSFARLGPDQRQALEGLGIKIGSQIGRIATAKIPVNSLGRVTELEFVDHIEGSAPMWMEKRQRGTQ